MLLSMTGAGTVEEKTPDGKLLLEVSSINRKFLDISVSVPKEMLIFETEIRKLVSKEVSRGLIVVRILKFQTDESMLNDSLNLSFLKKAHQKVQKLIKELKLPKDSCDVKTLLSIAPTQNQDQKISFSSIKKGLLLAIEDLLTMKKVEGKALKEDLEKRAKGILKHVETLKRHRKAFLSHWIKSTALKVKEIFDPSEELKDRVIKEIISYADKFDIEEEIVRLKAHIRQFHRLMREGTLPKGRKLEFLAQEMGREINTIGAKSVDVKIAHLVVEMKSELEKIKEQLQNVE